MLSPEYYHRDCQRCLKYVYDEETGQERKDSTGRPIERPPLVRTLCHHPDGSRCPKGTPDEPKILSVRNQNALHFYQCCKLTGQWPDDAYAMRWLVHLDNVLKQCERTIETRRRSQEMEVLLSAVAIRRGV